MKKLSFRKKTRNAKYNEKRSQKLIKRRLSAREIEKGKQALLSDLSELNLDPHINLVERMIVLFASHATQFKNRIHKLIKIRDQKANYLRNLQYLNNANRPAKRPDPLTTILFAMIFGLVEGSMAGLLLVAEGHMTWGVGIGYGMTFAAITIVVGILAGFWGLRFGVYRLDTPVPKPTDILVRIAARIWFLFCIALLVLLIFSSSRVRVLGSHHGILSFDVVSFWASFNDALSLALIILGITSSMIATWKGYSGFSDPVPGLTDARIEAEDHTDSDADDLLDEFQDLIKDAAETALDDCTEALKSAQSRHTQRQNQFAALNDKIRTHNDGVESDKVELEAAAASERDHYVSVMRKNPNGPVDLALGAFDALILPLVADIARPDSATLDDQITTLSVKIEELSAASDSALQALGEHYADYHISSPDLDIIPEPKGV